MRRFAFLAALLLFWLTAPAVHADGLLNAVSFQPLPQGAALFVRPLDNSDQNIALQAEFERELKQKGFTVSKDASLIFSFETRDAAGSWTGGGPNPFVELSNNHDQSGVNAPQVRFNLFNSNRGGILNPARKDRTRTVTPSRFRIDVTIDDRTNGKRLWQGWSTDDISIWTIRSMSMSMIPAIVNGMGKTVKKKSLTLQ